MPGWGGGIDGVRRGRIDGVITFILVNGVGNWFVGIKLPFISVVVVVVGGGGVGVVWQFVLIIVVVIIGLFDDFILMLLLFSGNCGHVDTSDSACWICSSFLSCNCCLVFTTSLIPCFWLVESL